MRWLFAFALGAAGCHGLLGLDDVGYREPVAAGGGGSGGGVSSGGGGEAPLDGTPRWLFVVDDESGAAEGAAQTAIDGVFAADGHVAVAVSFDGTVNLTSPTPSSSGEPNVLLVTVDHDGSPIRHRSFGGTKAIDARLATIGNEIFVAGTYYEPTPINVGGAELPAACTLAVDQTDCPADTYAIKYDEDLDLRWRRSEGPPEYHEHAIAIAALPDGVVIAGTYTDGASLYGQSLTAIGGKDVYLARLADNDSSSALQWIATDWGTAGDDSPVALAARKSTVALALQSSGATESFVVRALLPSDGSDKWAAPPAFLGSIAGLDVAVALDESVVAVARLTGEADTPEAGQIAPSVAAGQDLVVVRFDTNGNVSWLRQLAASGAIWTGKVAVDDQSHIVVAGTFNGTLDLGDGNVLDAGDSLLGFVAKLDEDGAPIWSRVFAPPGAETGSSVVEAVDVAPGGEVLAVGAFVGRIDFELIQVLATPGPDAASSTAAFAMQLGP